jgi:hypothetical protein
MRLTSARITAPLSLADACHQQGARHESLNLHPAAARQPLLNALATRMVAPPGLSCSSNAMGSGLQVAAVMADVSGSARRAGTVVELLQGASSHSVVHRLYLELKHAACCSLLGTAYKQWCCLVATGGRCASQSMARHCDALYCHTWPVLPCPLLPCSVLPRPVLLCCLLPCPVLPCPVLTCPVLPCP